MAGQSRPIYGPVQTDNEGVLGVFVAQPGDQSPEMMADGSLVWRETYKGPYKIAKNILASDGKGQTRQRILAYAPTALANAVRRFTEPTPNTNCPWRLMSARVQELEAGDHCLLTFVWVSSEKDNESLDDGFTQWNLSFGQESINVLAYCTNVEPPTEAPGFGYVSGESYQSRIQAWWNQPQDTAYYQPSYRFVSALGAGQVQSLGKAEIAIARKMQQGRNPMLHYPIITKTTTYLGKKTYVSLNTLDVIDEPTGSPFITDGWEFLKVGQTYNYNSKADQTVITVTWWGAKKWDEDFYSPDPNRRWQFGQVNDAALSGN